MGFLDMMHDYNDINRILDAEDQTSLGTDLQAFNRASKQWRAGSDIDVGESGTVYRLLQFAAWRRGEKRIFVKHGTLTNRPITNNPDITHLSLKKLLELDNGTSQWASAAVLLGNVEPRPAPMPFKLQLTYDAVEHWREARAHGQAWDPRRDRTIARQAAAYADYIATGKLSFQPEQAEDYCFARAFKIMTPEEGEAKWPSLRLHESDRIVEMEEALSQQMVTSADHRVVQAVAMLKGADIAFTQPRVVAKSWPLFWQMMDFLDI